MIKIKIIPDDSGRSSCGGEGVEEDESRVGEEEVSLIIVIIVVIVIIFIIFIPIP